MKNFSTLINVLVSFSLLTLVGCNQSKMPKVTTFGSDQTSSEESKPAAGLQFVNYKGYEWVAINNLPKPAIVFGEFNDDKILSQWYSLKSSTSDNPNELIQVQFNTVDIMMGLSEGNFIYDSTKNKLHMPLDIIHSIDPGDEKGVGRVNAGPASVNCFVDRPSNTILRPICSTLFKKTGSSLSQFANLDNDAQRDQFYDMKTGIYLGNYYQSVLRKNSKSIISILNSKGMNGLSTSLKLVYTDQSNQLGLGGATKLARIDKGLWNLSKAQILSRIKGVGIGSKDGIFVTGKGDEVNLNQLPLAMLRLAYARVQYHNSLGTLTEFNSKDQWLSKAAKRWTFSSLLKDKPNLKKEIKELIVAKEGEQDWSEVEFKVTQVAATKVDVLVTVEVTKGDKQLYTTQMPLGNGHVFKAQDVAFGDILRRIAAFPQSQNEYQRIKQASEDFLKNEYYQHFGLKP